MSPTPPAAGVFETRIRDGVLVARRPDSRWLSTGFDGGRASADAACLLSVPEGFDRTDLGAYVAERLRRADLVCDGPALLTGVDLAHARGACRGPVGVLATVGVSNPAALPIEPGEGEASDEVASNYSGRTFTPGTVNLVVGVERDLADGALANLVAVAAEAKATTLLAETGFPGTTTDAVAVAVDPGAETAAFSGSATEVGAAARCCVREAVRASLRSRYAEESPPSSVVEADHGVVTDDRAEVYRPTDGRD